MAENEYKCAMVTLGVIHIIDGIVLPSLWGVSWIWVYYTATDFAGPEVWGSILFFIPAGILGIIAGVSKNRGVAIASMVMNILGGVVALVVIILLAIVTGIDSTSSHSFALDIVVDGISIIVALLEGVVCIVAAVYSFRVFRVAPRPTPSTTVVYNAAAYPAGQQYPAQPLQTQYAGQPVQMLYTAQPAQAQYAGPGGQAPPDAAGQQQAPVQYATAPAQDQYAAPPPTEEKHGGPPEV
ncbi:uncharacterized protein LOC119731708 [Patiria miniata]|uniref:Uncharacterized protein n=1 Tax=Patiria miniata TaxID=46514 RepID=A0A914AAR9_PATMI|nr:uncharacterized protein LOC119731708 [Patiria miniata]